MTKIELFEAIVPDLCSDCEYMCISHASGLILKYGRPVATCKLNYARHGIDNLRGTYEPCEEMIFIGKCKYDN